MIGDQESLSRAGCAGQYTHGRTIDEKVSKSLSLKTVCSTGSARWGTTFNLINGKILRVAD